MSIGVSCSLLLYSDPTFLFLSGLFLRAAVGNNLISLCSDGLVGFLFYCLCFFLISHYGVAAALSLSRLGQLGRSLPPARLSVLHHRCCLCPIPSVAVQSHSSVNPFIKQLEFSDTLIFCELLRRVNWHRE